MVTRSRIKTLKIDGKEVGAREDETILELARENGIHIPTLCQMDGLSIVGACRLCLVEVEGWNRLVRPAPPRSTRGWRSSPTPRGCSDYRRQIVELLFAEGNHVCAICVSNGTCELQDMAVRAGHGPRPLSVPASGAAGRHDP